MESRVVMCGSPCCEQDSKLGAGAPIDLRRRLTLEERQRIVSEAMGTNPEDAEDLLRRQRARLDACACHLVPCGHRRGCAGTGVLCDQGSRKQAQDMPLI